MLFFSDIPWSALYQRPQHLARRFAMREPLLWVEPAVLGRGPGAITVDAGEGATGLVIPYFPFNARNSLLRTLAGMLGQSAFAASVLDRVQERMLAASFSRRDARVDGQVAYLQNFQAWHAIRRLHPRMIIYDCIDQPFGFTPLPKRVHALWNEAVRSADLLIASSPALAELLRRSSGREALVVSNGVEFARFSAPYTRPGDLPDDGRPIAGYIGSVYPWIDFDLLEQSCLALPSVRFVVVGKEHPEVRPRLASLSRLPNFLFLGARPYTAIPAYLRYFSAGLIPFRRNELTEGVNPVKLYEYAAAGVPIVATPFSADLALLGSVLQIADGTGAFTSAIQTAIGLASDPGHRSTLSSFARENDWDAKAGEIYRRIVSSNSPHN